ncbi:hypothetical protein Tco_1089696 [Tanacetum coccineum]
MEPIHTPVVDPLGTGAKYQVDETQSTRLRYRSLTKNEDKTSSKVELDTKPLQLQTFADIQAYLFSKDELDKESDEEEVFAAGDDMNKDIQAAKEVRTPSAKQDQSEPSNVQESASDSSTDVSYVDLKASIDQYYDENIAHRDQTDKLVEASMSSLHKSNTTIRDLYKGLDVITQLLKDINNVVLSLVKGFDFSTLLFIVKDLQAHALKQDEELAAWAKSSTNMAWTLAFKGQPFSAPSGSVTPTLALTHIPVNVKGENVTPLNGAWTEYVSEGVTS